MRRSTNGQSLRGRRSPPFHASFSTPAPVGLPTIAVRDAIRIPGGDPAAGCSRLPHWLVASSLPCIPVKATRPAPVRRTLTPESRSAAPAIRLQARVLATPGHTFGHTFGHTSLLPRPRVCFSRLMRFGALPRKLRIGVRGFLCADPTLARESSVKLAALKFTTAAVETPGGRGWTLPSSPPKGAAQRGCAVIRR